MERIKALASCKNKAESYGEYCERCNMCGRFDENDYAKEIGKVCERIEKQLNLEYVECHNCAEQYDCERTYLGGCTDGKKWGDSTVVYDRDYTIVQTTNNHISITKDGKMVAHFSCTSKKTESELKEYVYLMEKLIEEIKE